jgi:hypothetical protein
MYKRGDDKEVSDRINTWLEEPLKQAPFDGLAGRKAKGGESKIATQNEGMCGEPRRRVHL